MKTVLISIMGLLCLNSTASAHRCIIEYWTPVGNEVVERGECRETEVLAIASTSRSYPRLGNAAFTVRYWTGAIGRTDRIRQTYIREIYDDCRGRRLSEREITREHNSTHSFAISNPNLSSDVDATYKLAPMTDAEATTAYAELLDKCNQ